MTQINSLQLDRVVFIGRTYDEYLRMFDLDEALLRRGPVLDCAAGPSSFAAEAYERGIEAEIVKVPFEFQKGSKRNNEIETWLSRCISSPSRGG